MLGHHGGSLALSIHPWFTDKEVLIRQDHADTNINPAGSWTSRHRRLHLRLRAIAFAATLIVAAGTALVGASPVAASAQATTEGHVLVTPDKDGIATDGWFGIDDGKVWTSAGCRTSLEANGAPVLVMAWADLSAIADVPQRDCGSLLAPDDPSTPQPEETPSPGEEEASSEVPFLVVPPDKVGPVDGWVVIDGGRSWVDASCRRSLEDAGMELRVISWSEVAAIPDDPGRACDELHALLPPDTAPEVVLGRHVVARATSTEGGTVTLDDARLTVSAGILATDGDISITEVFVDDVLAYDFEIHVEWDGTVLVTVPADITGVDSSHELSELSVRHFNLSGGAWLTEPATLLDLNGETITAEVDHLSIFTSLARWGIGKARTWAEKTLAPENLLLRGFDMALERIDAFEEWSCRNGYIGMITRSAPDAIFGGPLGIIVSETILTPCPETASAPGTPSPTPPPEPSPQPPPPPPPAPGPQIHLVRGGAAPAGFWYYVTLSGYSPGSQVTVACHDSIDNYFWTQTLTVGGNGAATDTTLCYSADGPVHWVTAGSVQSNHVTW